MNKKLVTLINRLCIISVILLFSSCSCGDRGDLPCNTFNTKPVDIPVLAPASRTQYALGDTIKFSLSFSDTITDVTTGERIVANFNNLHLFTETFRIVTPNGSSIPNLQPVYSDFNPIITEGQVINENFQTRWFQFRPKKEPSRNLLLAGLECGRKGLYLVRYSFSGTSFPFSAFPQNSSQNPCLQFQLSTVYNANQNNGLFTTANINFIPVLPGFQGLEGVTKTDKNYVIFEVN
jgi:hypothetical protein